LGCKRPDQQTPATVNHSPTGWPDGDGKNPRRQTFPRGFACGFFTRPNFRKSRGAHCRREGLNVFPFIRRAAASGDGRPRGIPQNSLPVNPDFRSSRHRQQRAAVAMGKIELQTGTICFRGEAGFAMGIGRQRHGW